MSLVAQPRNMLLFPQTGCCDVLLDKDVNGVKLVNELCGTVLKLSDKYSSSYFPDSRLNKDAVKYCRNVIMETCDIDIHVLLKETIELGATSYKHVLDEIRTFNKSLCLKYHFDVTLELLGTPHRVRKSNATYTSSKRKQSAVWLWCLPPVSNSSECGLY